MAEPTNEPHPLGNLWATAFHAWEEHGHWQAADLIQQYIEAREAAAEHRGHIAGMREAAGIADMHDHRGETAQAIRQRATAIETGADHG